MRVVSPGVKTVAESTPPKLHVALQGQDYATDQTPEFSTAVEDTRQNFTPCVILRPIVRRDKIALLEATNPPPSVATNSIRQRAFPISLRPQKLTKTATSSSVRWPGIPQSIGSAFPFPFADILRTE